MAFTLTPFHGAGLGISAKEARELLLPFFLSVGRGGSVPSIIIEENCPG